ncbi:KRSC protein, partial [Corythaeola cristata]|nr:KRSC protein [Corythaeola cristata]
RCLPACEVTCTQPCAYSNGLEPCVASCGDSTAVVYAPPVIVTFPGPIISSCPQESYVGTSFPQSSGASPSYSSGNSYGVGGSSISGGVSGGSYSSGIVSGIGSSYGSGGYLG